MKNIKTYKERAVTKNSVFELWRCQRLPGIE